MKRFLVWLKNKVNNIPLFVWFVLVGMSGVALLNNIFTSIPFMIVITIVAAFLELKSNDIKDMFDVLIIGLFWLTVEFRYIARIGGKDEALFLTFLFLSAMIFKDIALSSIKHNLERRKRLKEDAEYKEYLRKKYGD